MDRSVHDIVHASLHATWLCPDTELVIRPTHVGRQKSERTCMMSLHTRNATADDHGLDKMAVRLQGLHTPLASSSGTSFFVRVDPKSRPEMHEGCPMKGARKGAPKAIRDFYVLDVYEQPESSPWSQSPVSSPAARPDP